jgi:protein phosphatase
LKTIYLLIGAPGSGKTTWAHNNAERLQASIISSDDVRSDFRRHGRDPLNGDAVFAEVERRARAALKTDQAIILDATHYTRKYRRYAIRLARELSARLIGVWLDLPLEECLRRNARRSNGDFGDETIPDQIVCDMTAHLQPPRPDEFDQLIVIQE